MGDKTTEEVLLICNKYLSTIGNSKPYQRCLKILDAIETTNAEKLTAVKEFAQQRRRVPHALVAWIDDALDQEKAGWVTPPDPKCPKCGNATVVGRCIDDIHDDNEYKCLTDGCDYRKIYEGPDA